MCRAAADGPRMFFDRITEITRREAAAEEASARAQDSASKADSRQAALILQQEALDARIAECRVRRTRACSQPEKRKIEVSRLRRAYCAARSLSPGISSGFRATIHV